MLARKPGQAYPFHWEQNISALTLDVTSSVKMIAVFKWIPQTGHIHARIVF